MQLAGRRLTSPHAYTLGGVDRDHAAALVEAAAWANPMGLCGHSALRAILQLGQLEHTVGGLALAAAAT